MSSCALRVAHRTLSRSLKQTPRRRLSSQVTLTAHNDGLGVNHDAEQLQDTVEASADAPVKKTRSIRKKAATSENGEPNTRKRSKKAAANKADEVETSESDPRKDPLEDNQIFLTVTKELSPEHRTTFIRAAPTIEDVEKHRPPQHADPERNLKAYAKQYNESADRLCRSFSKEQLRQALKLYGTVMGKSTTKLELAEAIIEKHWDWPSLTEMERQKRDRTEISTEVFMVDPAQLFVILGKDGSDLLRLSNEFNVHISLTAQPLALRVEGVKAQLKTLSERIKTLKEGILVESLQLPSQSALPPDVVQRLSRLAGAYVENVDKHGRIKICSKDPQSLETAKRLAFRATYDSAGKGIVPNLFHRPPSVPETASLVMSLLPNSYSLYPFFSPKSLPWTMSTSGVFRIRKVGEWLGQGRSEDIERTGGLARGQGQIITSEDQLTDIRNLLLEEFSDSEHSPTVTVSLGHVLYTSLDPSRRSTLIPPLRGHHPLPKLTKWLAANSTHSEFVPSLPSNLADSTLSEDRQVLHTLVYYADTDNDKNPTILSRQKLQFEIVFHEPEPPSLAPDSSALDTSDVLDDYVPEDSTLSELEDDDWLDDDSDFNDMDSFLDETVHGNGASKEDPSLSLSSDSTATKSLEPSGIDNSGENSDSSPSLSHHDVVDSTNDSLALPSRVDEARAEAMEEDEPNNATPDQIVQEAAVIQAAEPIIRDPPRCTVGHERNVNLLLPDRTMDLHFAVAKAGNIAPGVQPAELTTYYEELRASLEKNDQHGPAPPTVVTHNGVKYYLHSRMNVRQSTRETPTTTSDNPLDFAKTVSIVSERHLDLESNEKTVLCKVSCAEPKSNGEWRAFLRKIDQLTTSEYQSTSASSADKVLDL